MSVLVCDRVCGCGCRCVQACLCVRMGVGVDVYSCVGVSVFGVDRC